MNQITDELLRRQRSLFLAKRRKFVQSQRKLGVVGGGGGGLSVTVARAAGQASPANGWPVNFTVTFSQPVTGFAAADLNFGGSTVTSPSGTITGSGPSYNVAVTATGQGNVNLRVNAAGVLDAATGLIPNTVSNTATIAYDSIAPSVTVAAAAGQPDPAATPPITYTITFNEPVTGFIASDVVITGTAGGTKLVSLSGSGPAYNAEVSNMTTAGTVIATVPAGAAADLAGNLSTVSNSSTVNWLPDTTRPNVTINARIPTSTSVSPILFDVVFTEPVTGFNTAADVTVTFGGGGTPGITIIPLTPSTYTVSVTGMTTDGNVTASIPQNVCTDLAGNLNFASTSTDNIVQWIAPVGGGAGLKAPLGMGLLLN